MQVLADGCSVNRAIEKIIECEDSDDDDLIQLGLQPSTLELPGDMDIPMGASQSNPLSQPLPAPNSQQGKRPSQKRPPKSGPVPSLLPHPASLNMESTRCSQQPSHEQPSRQGSGSLGESAGRAGSLGAVGPSRLGPAGQGRASGCSQQARQSTPRTPPPPLFFPRPGCCSHEETFADVFQLACVPTK